MRITSAFQLGMCAAVTIAAFSAFAAQAQNGPPSATAPPPKLTITQPVFTPPPETPPSIPPRMPVIPLNPQVPHILPLQPTDLTHQVQVDAALVENVGALNGIKVLDRFPTEKGGEMDQVLVRARDGSSYLKLNGYTVQFDDGEILVSVRRPTRIAYVVFGEGKIALTADCDVMLKKVDDVVHIVNLDGRGETVKIKLSNSLATAQNAKVIALAPGYEVIAGNRVLKHSDIRIADGAARRHFKMLEDGKVAVCEICVGTVLSSSVVISKLDEKESDRHRKLLCDMSKMAAVLNYVNGIDGYKTESAQ